METNTTFFVALLGKENFESQTVLTTDHLLSQSHRLLRMVIVSNIKVTKQNVCQKTHGTKYHRYAPL